MNLSKSDWKKFQELLPLWQERYMDKLIKEYISLLSDESRAASLRYHELEEKINNNRNYPGVHASFRPDDVSYILSILLRDGVISKEDLTEFSHELICSII